MKQCIKYWIKQGLQFLEKHLPSLIVVMLIALAIIVFMMSPLLQVHG